jgi:hypothetical protein
MIVVASFVALGAWNRSAEPRLTITLSERELTLWPSGGDRQHQPLRLRLAYEPRFDPLDTRNWLPESRLRELGFALTVPAGDPRAADEYDNVPARLGWVALELDGPAWREIERRRDLLAAESAAHLRPDRQSRLVPVDASADFDTLRVRYPSGHLIVRGVIGLAYVPPDRGGPVVHGTLRFVVPESVAVPASLRGVFEHVGRATPGAQGRYEVELAIGKLGLPYVRSARAPAN